MTESNENNRETVPTRLSFVASPDLNRALQEFVKPEIRDVLQRKDMRFHLFSEQIAHLGLLPGPYSNDQDMIDIEKYEDAVNSLSHTDFNLLPEVDLNRNDDRFVQIKFNLFFYATRERRALIQRPLYPAGYTDDMALYTRIPRERAVSGAALNLAEAKLKNAMGVDQKNTIIMAPYTMSVGHPTVFKRWNNSVIPITSRSRKESHGRPDSLVV